MTNFIRYFICASISTILMTTFVSAATFTVNTTLDVQDAAPGNGVCATASNKCSLRAAITEANANSNSDTINIPAGVYTQTLSGFYEDANAGGDWDITGTTKIKGPVSGVATLQAGTDQFNGLDRVLDIVSPAAAVSIAGVVIQNGVRTGVVNNTNRGGAIRNLGSLTLLNSVVRQSRSVQGGGIYTEGYLEILNSDIAYNRCEAPAPNRCRGGNIYAKLRTGESVSITDSVIRDGYANFVSDREGEGAGMAVEGNGNFFLTISDSEFFYNRAGDTGGQGAGIFVLSANGAAMISINRTVIRENYLANIDEGEFIGAGISLLSSGAGSINAAMHRANFHQNDSSGRYTVGGGLSARATGGPVSVLLRESSFSENWGIRGGGVALISDGGPNAVATLNAVNTTFYSNYTLASAYAAPNIARGSAIRGKRQRCRSIARNGKRRFFDILREPFLPIWCRDL